MVSVWVGMEQGMVTAEVDILIEICRPQGVEWGMAVCVCMGGWQYECVCMRGWQYVCVWEDGSMSVCV